MMLYKHDCGGQHLWIQLGLFSCISTDRTSFLPDPSEATLHYLHWGFSLWCLVSLPSFSQVQNPQWTKDAVGQLAACEKWFKTIMHFSGLGWRMLTANANAELSSLWNISWKKILFKHHTFLLNINQNLKVSIIETSIQVKLCKRTSGTERKEMFLGC